MRVLKREIKANKIHHIISIQLNPFTAVSTIPCFKEPAPEIDLYLKQLKCKIIK